MEIYSALAKPHGFLLRVSSGISYLLKSPRSLLKTSLIMDKPLSDAMAAKTQEGPRKSFLTAMLLQDAGLRIYPAC